MADLPWILAPILVLAVLVLLGLSRVFRRPRDWKPVTIAIDRALATRVEALLQADQKIQAIKLVREETGLGLKEAKDQVDAQHARLRGEVAPSEGPLADRLAALIQDGEKLQAIKLLREETGLGLKEAKEQIDALAAGRQLELAPPSPALDGPLDTRLEALIRQGQKIEAIKLLRGETGLGLKEAKERVDALAARLAL